ncbi:MAG TPA: hypothetical protein VK772_07530 [Puia sp.]|nr:hypothetical protein [Puia sp.]
MKASLILPFVCLCCIYFSLPLMAQDNPAVLRNSYRTTPVVSDSLLLKDSSIIKKDTAKQVANSDSSAPTPSHLELNLVYQSNDVNNGRKDSTVIPTITPKISYIFQSGFEIDLSVGYNVHEPSPQVNQYTLDGSYSFNPGNYSGSVTLSGFIYSKSSGSVTSEQRGSLAYSSSYSFSFIQPSVNLTWTFGNHIPDYQVSPALQQQFNIGNLNITPTVTMNAATQNSYNSYYQNRRFNIPRSGKPLPDSVTLSGEVLNSDKFQILDYEFSAPINFTAGNWTFNFTPTYAMPINPADIKATITTNHISKSVNYKETLPNTFYWQIGVTYDFLKKKKP